MSTTSSTPSHRSAGLLGRAVLFAGLGLVAATAPAPIAHAEEVKLLNVSYDPTR
jgi:ABC-type sulfate transport system substrate-binding protein